MPVFSKYVAPEHTKFGERWRELKKAQAEVKDKRETYRLLENDFQCVEEQKAAPRTEIVIDNDGGAHTVQDVAMPLPCFIVHRDKECENINCPHKPWNTKMVGAFVELKDARHERNLAFWNLFGLKTRVINIQEYRKLKKETKVKTKEVFSLYCAYTIAEGIDAVRAQDEYDAALKEYAELVAKYNVARRKAWGRNK